MQNVPFVRRLFDSAIPYLLVCIAVGGAMAAVTSAETQSQPDLELKEITGVDRDGKPVEFIQFYDGRGKDGPDNPNKASKPVIVRQILPQRWVNDTAALKAAKQAFLEGFLQTPVFRDYADRYVFLMRKQSNLQDLKVRPSGIVDDADGYFKEIDRSIEALAPIMPIPVHSTVFTKSSNGVPAGYSDPVSTRLNESASTHVGNSVIYPEKETPNEYDKKVDAHEFLWAIGAEEPQTPEEYAKSITGIGFEFLERDEKHVRWLHTANNGNYNARFQTPGFKTFTNTKPGYALSSANYAGVKIPVELPPVTTQYRLGVYPSKNPLTGEPDGPAMEMIVGDRKKVAEVIQNKSIFLPAPNMPERRDFTLLPGRYSYVLCISADVTGLAWNPVGAWEQDIAIWPNGLTVRNHCKSGEFDTRGPDLPTSKNIHPIGWENGYLRWADDDLTIFYYEIQVSGDDRFDTNPDTATSFVWWNLIHGGMTDPPNSWKTPRLDPGAYHWRVRPRIQGDGVPVEWSETWSFTIRP